MTLTVLVFDAEEGGYWAEVPEIPGCVSQGETLDELRINIMEAIEACLAAHREESSMPLPRAAMKWDISISEDGPVTATAGI